MCELREVAELPFNEKQSVRSKLNTTESNNEEKLCVIDDIAEGLI